MKKHFLKNGVSNLEINENPYIGSVFFINLMSGGKIDNSEDCS